eukprot:CAMPEP_0169388894 /NCGR_PEP_ID=MMETSP1017-20121227/46355_1 /TAXON_ID=342587 /ORGANISM="Karlodinium micrum, Strain CCMP2283" /LENGTH=36 /DNA_ID= /DNA_START= /DNA_END= /DNA_ORIENTATION=
MAVGSHGWTGRRCIEARMQACVFVPDLSVGEPFLQN